LFSDKLSFSYGKTKFLEPLNRLGCPVFVVDQELRLKKANPLFFKLFDVKLDDRLDADVGFRQLKQHFSKAFIDGTDYSKNSFEVQCFDKKNKQKIFIAAITTFFIPDADDLKDKLVLVILQDITDHKRLEKELFQRDRQLSSENIRLKESLKKQFSGENIVGQSREIKKVLVKIEQASETDVPVLIEGESGTGKELVAQRIHKLSGRNPYNFIAVNCGGIPKHLAESLLFGHKKGAFTGAFDDNIGYIQKANNGTLFLDEINSLPLSIQVKLLRVLDDSRIFPVGANIPIKINFRLICASNEKVQEAVMKKTIRSDFYYRINVLSIPIPPLRNRKSDIPLLADYFLTKYREDYTFDVLDESNLYISSEILLRLKKYSFPGNVRELKNILYRYFTVGELDVDNWRSPPVDEISSPGVNMDTNLSVPSVFDETVPLKDFMGKMEKAYISQLLIENKFNKSAVAETLGVGRKTLYLKIKKYGL
jgi:transcriptional regulator with PAS, ATPase and Fis domain